MTSRLLTLVVLVALVAVPVHLLADVRTEERTRVELGGVLGRMANLFGGKAAREGVTSTVIVKGDRKLMMGDSVGQIVDLREERIYDLDMERKTYRVTTFEQVRQQMEEARKKAEAAAREEQKTEPDAAPPPQNENNVEFDFDVKNTGQTRTINGFSAKQTIATVTVREKGKTLEENGGLVVTSDMWMAPKNAAMQELVDFELRYAQKMYGPMLAGVSQQDMAAALAIYPTIAPALERLNKEAGNLDGTAIQTIVTMEAVKSKAQMAAEQAERKENTRINPTGGIGGLVGGLARRSVQRGDIQPRAMVMRTTNDVLKIATQVTDAEVAMPEGFKQQ